MDGDASKKIIIPYSINCKPFSHTMVSPLSTENPTPDGNHFAFMLSFVNLFFYQRLHLQNLMADNVLTMKLAGLRPVCPMSRADPMNYANRNGGCSHVTEEDENRGQQG